MQKYKTMTEFSGEGVIPVLKAIVTAIQDFFPVMLFVIFIFGTASSYFAILKTTGKKRFWHALTAMSFVTFLMSLLVAGMNVADEIPFLEGYWVGFYILMTLASWFMLDRYK